MDMFTAESFIRPIVDLISFVMDDFFKQHIFTVLLILFLCIHCGVLDILFGSDDYIQDNKVIIKGCDEVEKDDFEKEINESFESCEPVELMENVIDSIDQGLTDEKARVIFNISKEKLEALIN
ncbi:hypothetical protein E1N66_18795 [Pantoea allii]|nr:hypothetical protein [Pantoea allii]THB82852.1 hypothetical protein E1N66_18795 [Pantoea allii]